MEIMENNEVKKETLKEEKSNKANESVEENEIKVSESAETIDKKGDTDPQKTENEKTDEKEEIKIIEAEKDKKETGDESCDKNNENPKKNEDYAEIDEETTLGLKDPESLDGKSRDKIFERGAQFDKKGKRKLALKCYLACLTGLKEDSSFNFLPQCLHNVADIYYAKEEFEKAVQFIQAEKMFYETSLINISGLQKKIESDRRKQSAGDQAEESVSEETQEALQAQEYENLAKLCLEKSQPQLALEYQAKATKLRQQVYGDDHPLTAQSLDFFTVLYGEVGKHQYSESLKKYENSVPSGGKDQEITETDSKSHPDSKEEKADADGSKAGDKKENQDKQKKNVRIQDTEEQQRKEEWISHILLMILFVICAVILGLLMVYSYCELSNTDTCLYLRSEVHYWYMRTKYYYYHYTTVAQDKQKYA